MRTATPSAPKSAGPSTRERLLAAATEVFAQHGLMAATTREIAQTAGVNEVTLFRLFQSKQNLLAAVIERVFSAPPIAPADKPAQPEDLRACIQNYAEFYRARLGRNVRLIRVLIGEIQHCDEHARAVVIGVFHPQRQEFIEQLRALQKRGLIRPDADPVFIADQLKGMILTSTLRSDMPMPCGYSGVKYLESCVDVIVRAYEAEVAAAGRPQTASSRSRLRIKA